MKRYAISWKTRDQKLILRVCRYLNVAPYMSVNRFTRIAELTEEQRQALAPLEMNGSIRVMSFTE